MSAAYAGVVEKYRLAHDVTWMIGNSPKSDINPALAAGLHAVFVPHGDTWILEHEEVNPAPAGRDCLSWGASRSCGSIFRRISRKNLKPQRLGGHEQIRCPLWLAFTL